jgi:tRNA(Ile)-lysidine synthase
MSLPERFLQFIQEKNLFQPKQKLLLAVSGGVDSAVMANLCFLSGFPFAMAHCNFGLRGAESDRDEHFVRKLAPRYEVEIFVKQFDTAAFAKENSLSVQEAARMLRYNWFDELLNKEELVLSRLLTAHHADDNVETLLMHLLRGTGIKGLTGIPVRNDKIVRPLLFARRTELEEYARENKLEFVEDSSNQLDKYDRNFLRNQALPLLRTHYPDADRNLIASIERFGEAEAIYREAIELKKKKLMEPRGLEWHIPVRKLKKQTPLTTIVYELVKPFGFTAAQTGEVVRLLDAGTGKQMASATHRVIKNRDWIIIAPLGTEAASVYIIHKAGDVTETENGTLTIKEMAKIPQTAFSTSAFEALMDIKDVRFPLVLRRWKTGDYFYPLGMKKKKKLSRFFIDMKLSKTEKEKIMVLESNKKIIWIPGYRLDERVKITNASVNGLLCLFQPTTI